MPWIGFALVAFVFVGCASKPTQVVEKSQVLESAAGTGLPESTVDGKPLNEEVVLLDARPAFVAAVSKIKQAQILDWRDFTRRVAPRPNALEGDLFFHTRRLARMGIAPETKVLVLGRGMEGDGEEGRLAWTLRYLGVARVDFQNVEDYRAQMQTHESPAPKEMPVWRPILNENMLETRAELIARVKSGQKFYFVELTQKDREIRWPDQMQWGAAQRVKFTQADFLRMVKTNPESLRSLFSGAMPTSPATQSEDPTATTSPVEVHQLVVVDPAGEMAGYATAALRDLGFQASCACSGASEYIVEPKDLRK